MDTAATKVYDACIDPVKNLLFSAIGYVASCSDNLKKLEDEVKKLQGKEEDVNKDLEDADRKDQSATADVTVWLKRAKELQDDAKKMKAEFESMCKCIGSCGPNVVSRYRLSKKFEELKNRAEELCKNIPPISRNSDPNQFVERLCVENLVGRGSVLGKLHKHALDRNVRIIGIYGMAGVGKTELLNKFYKEFHESNPDHRMIWVNMKGCRNEEDTIEAITERLGLLWNDNDKQEVRANRITRNIDKKSFILILDDMWSAVNLKDIGVPIATQHAKSKVILATRSEDICDIMEAEKIQIKCLQMDEAWNLFVDKAGKDLNKSKPDILHPEIQHQAEILVRKCGGLPLALVTIGRAMARKRTLDLWKHAVTALDNTPEKIRGMKEVLSSLKLSYDNLPEDKSKTCLLYCAMFPESHRIFKQHIVDYCIGEGVLVDRFYEGDHVYNEGYYLLDVLQSASMIEPSIFPDHIKMHPMIRILVSSIERGTGETKCLIRARKGLVEAPDVGEWGEVERVSLIENNIEALLEIPNSPRLLTLLLNNNPLHKICDGFFRSMTNLRVLDLSHTSIQEVPPEIGDLDQLQYLNFCDTKITSLPHTLGKLVRLRYFLVSETPNLRSIPEGLFKNLTKLRVIYMEYGYDNWRVDPIGEGPNLDELQFLKRLKAFGISVNTSSAKTKLAGSHLARRTSHLDIKNCTGLDSKLSTAAVERDFKALKKLYIRGCSDLKELSIDASRADLLVLDLIELPRAVLTWNGGYLQNLMILTIDRCVEIRQLIHCKDEGLDEEESSEINVVPIEINVLPTLYRLQLYNLPELESLSCGSRRLAFPSLEVLKVKNCPKLKKLPLHAQKLRRIFGQSSWWNGLDWTEDHHNIKSKFQSIFKEISETNSQVERPAAVGLGAEDKNPV